ncbi:MAG TPA: PAS domain-containing protein, partial [Candidatus Thermoplasmatota archaeon]|nr:PAS domain-containing protein [Candidatus Thermoplasmatota archaeon]
AHESFGSRLWSLLPRGLELRSQEWAARHAAIVAVVLAHAVGVAAFGFARGVSPTLVVVESGLIGALGLLASWRGASRRFASAVASLALVTASSVIVQFSGGYIEAHFHFFVILAVIAVYQDWVPFLLAILYVALDHGIIGTLAPEMVYNHPDAFAHPWKWAGIHAAMVLGESAALLTGWKISERARERTDLVLASTAEGIVGLDAEGRVTFANASAERILGTGGAALRGIPLREAVAASWPDAPDFAQMDGVARGGARVAGLTMRAIEWTRSPIETKGALQGCVVTLRDVTEKASADEARERALSVLAATLESTTDGILVIAQDGKIAGFNGKFVEMWGIPPDVMAAREDDRAIRYVLSQLADPDAFVLKIKELYASPETSSFDVLEFKDGRVFERYSQPQRLNGQTIGRVWSFRDVTERRRSEEAILSSRVARPLVKRLVQNVLDETHADASVLQQLGERIAREADASELDALCRAYAQLGLGRLALVEHDGGRRYTFRGEHLFENVADARTTTCHVALGFLCGAVARAAPGRPATRGTELTCRSRGDAECRFVVHAKAAENSP